MFLLYQLRSSGVDTKGLEEPIKTPPPKSATSTKTAPASSPMASPEGFPLDTKSRNLFPPDSPSAPGSRGTQPRAAEEPNDKRTFFIVLAVVVAILIQVVHMSVTAPLGPGHTLSPNGFISKCGYKALVPAFCEEATLSMDEDGVLTLYDSQGDVEWQMSGSVCVDDNKCKNGLAVNDDGSLEIGGKRVNVAAIYGQAQFAPWPFTVSPSVRLVKGRK